MISFGTDGWRAIIGENFTYENVRHVIQAFCDLYPGESNRHVFLGYDRRFCSPQFAEAAAEVLLGNDFTVSLASNYCPTPCISWMTKRHRAFAGIMVTASHNPYFWNGIKFKEGYGGSASPEYTRRIELQFQKNRKTGRQPKKTPLLEARRDRRLKSFDPQGQYLNHIRKMIRLDSIRDSGIRVLYDAMHGAGAGFFEALLPGQVVAIREEEDFGFGGVNPEPIEKNLQSAALEVRKRRAAIALATDGDADRIGALDEKGNFISSQQIFALILRHLVEVRGWKGDVVKTVSATQMIDRMAARYGLTVHETPIGFKHICQQFLKGKPLMGGEESGGIGIANHVFERDGIVSGLFLLEVLAEKRMPLSKILRELQSEFGPLSYLRADFSLSVDRIEKIRARIRAGFEPAFPSSKLLSLDSLDGFKYRWTDDSWLLVRASGTEPLLRVYAESSTLEKTQSLIEAGRKLVSQAK